MVSVPSPADTARELLVKQRTLDADSADLVTVARSTFISTVDYARRIGLEWTAIAEHLGTTPEAARKRYDRGVK